MEHILVIEDDPAIRDLLRRGLTYENYKVTIANDGTTGLTAARDNPPDLVILDWMMPGHGWPGGVYAVARGQQCADFDVDCKGQRARPRVGSGKSARTIIW